MKAISICRLSVLFVTALAACTPPPDAGSAPDAEAAAVETTIVLPDGSECRFAGRGATLAFEGKRLNYTCSESQGLIGEVVIANGMEMMVEVATIDGTTITDSEPLSFWVGTVELADGPTCLNAGQGATLAFEDQRLNYTCSDDTVLIGEISQSEATFRVDQAFVDGTTIVAPVSTRNIAVLQAADQVAGMITGTIAYPQRVALPADATVVVTLENISRADAPAATIAQETFTTTGQQVPIPFSLSYDPADIEERDRYAVRAQIFYGDDLRWTSTTVYPVITQGQPTEVDIQLEQVGS